MERRVFAERPRRVALFVTCMVDMMYPNVGMSTVELLERQGIEVLFPEEQTCCGQPAFNAGFRDEARVLAERFIDIFEPLVRSGRVDAVVAPSGSCTTMVSHFYQVLFEEPMLAATRRRAEFLSTVTFELTEFLVDVLGVTDVGARFNGRLTYHACCHLLRELGVDGQPRALIEGIDGAEVVELSGAEDCCGFGGLFAIKNAPISTAMGERKIGNIAAGGADVVTLCDVSCMTHINGLLSRAGQTCRAVHIAEVLNNQVHTDTTEAEAPASSAGSPASSAGSPASSAGSPASSAGINVPRRWQDPRADE